mgnify:CR=1 FL=1
MLDLPWKVFEKTGNIETYLLMKQMEETYRKMTDHPHKPSMGITISNSRT